MSWLTNNGSLIVQYTVDHIALALPAILLAAVISIPIGRFAYRFRRAGGVLLSATTLLYAVPSLPLLVVVPAIVGIPLRSRANLIIVLTVYGVALLVRTVADAFASVDPSVREAAFAVGHSRRSIAWRVDLALATPVIIAGIRVMAVSTIGLVTIGALIGVPSLGSLLTDGFQRGITAEVTTGLVCTVLLAVAVDALILGLGRLLTPWASKEARA